MSCIAVDYSSRLDSVPETVDENFGSNSFQFCASPRFGTVFQAKKFAKDDTGNLSFDAKFVEDGSTVVTASFPQSASTESLQSGDLSCEAEIFQRTEEADQIGMEEILGSVQATFVENFCSFVCASGGEFEYGDSYAFRRLARSKNSSSVRSAPVLVSK